MHDHLKKIKQTYLPALLNSYSVVFFFNNRIVGIILLIVTFFNVEAGLSGLAAVIATIILASALGFDEARLRQGLYSFNSLLAGIGMGTFFDPGIAYFVLLFLAVLVSFILSVVLSGWLGKSGLPYLSLPFVLSFWLVLLPSGHFANLGLTQRNIFWINEMYEIGGDTLLNLFQVVESLPLSKFVTFYLRSLGSIFFQDHLLTGILIAAVLLAGSRIVFLLSLAGFASAYLFAIIVGSGTASFSFYNAGANYILVAIAAGGFFTVPSKNSFLWVVFLVPLTSLVILFLTSILEVFNLPVLSFPFSIVVTGFIYFLLLRTKQEKIVLTPYQHYSPEINLYSYSNYIDRKTGTFYLPIHLPFWGEWTVSQGYNGRHTHLGDWSEALDFVITDESGSTHSGNGGSCQDYYCFGKPVLAPADGTVDNITDNVDDNEPGKINSVQNWGNTIVLKHRDGLYSQLSHIRKGSFRFRQGDYVRKGDIVASCGNSGRSPEPHLHMQVQATPLPGSRPVRYPIAYYFRMKQDQRVLYGFSIPSEGEKITGVPVVSLLKEAFDLQPGMMLSFRYGRNDGSEKKVSWEVLADSWNNRYLYCLATQSAAYFVNDGTMFYFTSFYGSRKSLLYHFYLCSYRVLLGYHPGTVLNDSYPLHLAPGHRLLLWLNDFISPFSKLISANYSVIPAVADSPADPTSITLESETAMSFLKSKKANGRGTVVIAGNSIAKFSYKTEKYTLWAEREHI